MRQLLFVITLLTAAAAPAQSAEAEDPTAAGFGGVEEPDVLLQRIEKLEAQLAAQSRKPPATAEDAATLSAALQESNQRLAAVQQQIAVLEAQDAETRSSALERAGLAAEAINALQLADYALYFGEDVGQVNAALAAASLALDQAEVEADRMGRVVEREDVAAARSALEEARSAVARADASNARDALAVAYRRSQQARSLAANDGE